jgi:hypothetical protein
MTHSEIQPWLFAIAPLPGESLSHFLGRFRRRNHLTPNSLGQIAKIGAVVARWERFHLNPYPTQQEFEALAEVVGVDVERLWEMLPPMGEGMKCEPIRLCGACYDDSPCHRIEWQYQSVWKCVGDSRGVSHRHQLKLLAKCPKCEARFNIPALWEDGRCDRCRTTFGELAAYQKSA